MTVPAVVELVKYGVRVKVDPETEALRPTHCLCLRCARLVRCAAAHDGLHICRRYHIAYMVTRCPDFERDSRGPRESVARPSEGFRGSPSPSGGPPETPASATPGEATGQRDGGNASPEKGTT